MLIPRSKFPEIEVPTLDGEHWSTNNAEAENFIMVVVYRGHHCPVCKKYNKELQDNLEEFEIRGVSVVAISCDSQEKAQESKEEWSLDKLNVGYNLSIDAARELGLYISSGLNEKEPDFFSEPGLFLLKPDGTVHAAFYQSIPFARPPIDKLLKGIDYILEEDYPERGVVKEEIYSV